MPNDRYAGIRQRRVAFLYDVGRHVWMPWTTYEIPLASDLAAVVPHRRRPGFHLVVVVGVVAYPNQIDHLRAGLRTCVDCAALNPALYNPPVFRGISNSPELEVVSDF